MEPRAFAAVMAGGSGTRLWPLSTPNRPKQFIVLDGRSLIQRTVARLAPLFPSERIHIVTVEGQDELVRQHLPEIPHENIIKEPLGRNTAPCVGLAALFLKKIDPTAVMVALPADHHIEKEERLRQALALGIQVAEAGYLVTLGIVPHRPATGYGYIEAGEVLRSLPRDDLKAHQAKSFTEKPHQERAEEFLNRGNYYWNSGIFIWKVERILEEIQGHMPKLGSGLRRIEAHWEAPHLTRVIAEVYREQEAVSIDHGVMERASRAAVIPVEMGWNDLGDWNSLSSIFPKDQKGNVIRARHLGIDLGGSTIFSLQDRLIATIGLKNMVIVDTPEALLVMDGSRAQEAKDIATKVEKA